MMSGRFKTDKELNFFKKVVYSKGFVIFLIIITIFVGFKVWDVYYKSLETKKKLNNSIEILNTVKEKENEFISDIQYLKSAQGIEKEIRDTYGMVKKNEELVRIINSKENVDLSDTKKDDTFWERIKNMF